MGFYKKIIKMLKHVSANKMWEQTRRLRFTENVVIISLQHFQQIKKANVLGVGGRVLAAGEVCGGRALCKNARGCLGKDTGSCSRSQMLLEIYGAVVEPAPP